MNNNKVVEKIEEYDEAYSKERKIDNRISEIQEILRNGNKESKEIAFGEICEEYKYFIKKQVTNLFINGLDKEDIIQEATFYFYKAILSYNKDKGAFIAYARKYIRNNILTIVTNSRKNQKYGVSFVYLDGYSSDESKNNYDDYLFYNAIQLNSDDDRGIEKSEFKNMVDEIIDKLTKKEKIVLYLYLKDYSYEQIAKKLNIPEKSVDNALHRAKVKMKNVDSNFII